MPFPNLPGLKSSSQHELFWLALGTSYFGGCVISIAQIAAGRMYIDAR